MKRSLIKVAAIIAYYSGLDLLFYWLNRHAKRIITFHNVLPDEMFRDGVANGVSNRLSDFIRIVRQCRRRFRISNDLMDARTLTITFDDGYHNQYEYAFKALKKMGIPAYLFVAGGTQNGALTIDKLTHWVSEAPIEFIPKGNRAKYWQEQIWPMFLSDPKGRGASVLEKLDAIYPYEKILASLPQDYKVERLSGLSVEELDEMRQAGWRIGWHTQSHYPLSRLTDLQIKEELSAPDEFKTVCFSFPYGEDVSVDARSIRFAKEAGFPCAVSNTVGSVNQGAYFLPRTGLPSDRFLLHFALSGLKYFLKCCKLLPRTDRD